MSDLRDKLRLAIYNGLQQGERAIELTDRVLEVLAESENGVAFIRDPEHPARLPTAYNYEQQGTGYDQFAVGYERQGRKRAP